MAETIISSTLLIFLNQVLIPIKECVMSYYAKIEEHVIIHLKCELF